ncbi:TPA: hypothetical protein ACFP4Y_001379 [Neisseria bacilliformis]
MREKKSSKTISIRSARKRSRKYAEAAFAGQKGRLKSRFAQQSYRRAAQNRFSDGLNLYAAFTQADNVPFPTRFPQGVP